MAAPSLRGSEPPIRAPVAGSMVMPWAWPARSSQAGQRRRPRHRLLHVESVVDHRRIGLQVDLRLTVGAHAAEDLPQGIAPEGERGDEGVQWNLPRLEAVRMRRVEAEIGAPVLEHDAGAPR